ncbi:ribosomal protein S18-alanine N-acetyltransferase [Oleiagrimonas sp. MCCC 1A03011]|uniref:ribosomal protein S18-alanine N-acetyltransferase n=1 Tax=Oleiagrimonas sp. MCCC 1A03011 TaxID=1926883 RepID=UPI000DC52834|nr:ribosomal protein S18-alanine N-acetyltransferase [Oleiagrimonas sp. MCCC 1A03011]RAP58535.1 ribosomal-protein-alanine N-acetyltransferase [Oleiagrimonas sp. MCCC 1A03011]
MAAVVAPNLPRIRMMRREDLPQVSLIEREAYEFPWSPGIFRDCMKAGHACWVLAWPGEVVGYGILSAAAGEAHVLNLCVDPQHQGMGHGRRMLRRLLDLARWHGASRVFLEVRPSNEAAHKLYLDHDFVEIGRRPRYYPAEKGREDAIVMMHKLAPDQPDQPDQPG